MSRRTQVEPQGPGMPMFPAHAMPYQMHLPGNKASTQSGSQKPLVPSFSNVDRNSSLARRGATGHDLPIPPAAYLHGTLHYGPYPYPFPPPNAGAHLYRSYNVSGQNEAAPRNTPASLPQEESGKEVRANNSASFPNDADGPDLGLTLGPSFPKKGQQQLTFNAMIGEASMTIEDNYYLCDVSLTTCQ